MRCRTVQAKLDVYATGELPERLHGLMEEHLELCADCRTKLERVRKLSSLLGSVPPPPVPSNLSELILTEARERMDAPAEVVRWWDSVPRPMQLAAAAVLAIGLALGALMGHHTWRCRSDLPNPVAQVGAYDVQAVYALDPLAEAPVESLASAYLVGQIGPAHAKD